MGSRPGISGELSSWKEIAEHLGVTVRTAQRWEQERGLPVRRLPGRADRGPVYALTEELDAWRRSAPPEGTEAPASPGRWSAVAVAVLMTIAAVAAVAWWQTRPGPPASFQLEPGSLVILDSHGREVWRKTFDARLHPDMLDQRHPFVAIEDLGGDGRVEVLFRETPADFVVRGTALVCFSDRGEEKWRFVPGRAVASARERFDSAYYVSKFVVARAVRDGPKVVFATSWHANHYPAQVVRLSAQGKVEQEYWHSGRLPEMEVADLDQDGVSEVYLGGVNNAHATATLVVLDAREFHGAAQEPAGGFQLRGFAPPNEKVRMLLPRSCINRMLQPYNGVIDLRVRPEGLLLRVDEGTRELPLSFLYYLTASLRVENVEPGDAFRHRHAELYAQRRLDHPLSPRELEDLTRLRLIPLR